MMTEIEPGKQYDNDADAAQRQQNAIHLHHQHFKPYEQEKNGIQHLVYQLPELTKIIPAYRRHAFGAAFVAGNNTCYNHGQRAGYVQPLCQRVAAHYNSQRHHQLYLMTVDRDG